MPIEGLRYAEQAHRLICEAWLAAGALVSYVNRRRRSLFRSAQLRSACCTFHIVATRNATDAAESPNMKAAGPMPLKSPTRRWETMAPMK